MSRNSRDGDAPIWAGTCFYLLTHEIIECRNIACGSVSGLNEPYREINELLVQRSVCRLS